MSAQEIATKTTYAASAATTIVAGLDFNELIMLLGMLIALAGYLTNLFFQWRKDKRESRVAEFSIAQAKARIQDQKNEY
ncbi:holin [Gayadomonas joobiniege]|uniref:holin n=1 Tax=Gayadomonas joobiniege TaxID=1234606 RepID=UPI000381E552|nr:hypothetical protein [Gayadomonas joobiniege]